MKILLLKGGDSAEREVSLMSAENMREALTSAGYEVLELDLREGKKKILETARDVKAVFLALHGEGGEDGQIQKTLEVIGVPYLGSDSNVSQIAFDKILTHEILEKAGIKMPVYRQVSSDNIENCDLLEGTFVAKPIRGGSSIDTVISRDAAKPKIKEVFSLLEKYKEILIEELINGKELTVPILGSNALLPVLAIPPDGEEFDYQNKYNGKSQEIVPIAEDLVSLELQQKLQRIAEKVHNEIGAKHVSRVDFIVDESDEIYVLEINTLPGMTKESFYPKSAKAAGMSSDVLVKKLIELIIGDN